MEEKNNAKISLSTFFLILAIIAIIVMGIFIYKLNNDKITEIQKSTELQSKISTLETQNNNLNGMINTLQEKKINNSNETTNTAVSEKSEENIVKNNIEGNEEIEYNKNF